MWEIDRQYRCVAIVAHEFLTRPSRRDLSPSPKISSASSVWEFASANSCVREFLLVERAFRSFPSSPRGGNHEGDGDFQKRPREEAELPPFPLFVQLLEIEVEIARSRATRDEFIRVCVRAHFAAIVREDVPQITNDTAASSSLDPPTLIDERDFFRDARSIARPRKAFYDEC